MKGPESELYRDEARYCRLMARTTTAESSRRWSEMADEYEQLAVPFERAGHTTDRRGSIQHVEHETSLPHPIDSGRPT